jgi:CRP-like cAMP-binding protein
LIRHGKVALEVHAPKRGPITIQTLSEGEVLGWSWLVRPYHWHFDARAVEVTRAIALDGECLRQKSENDCCLGYELLKRFSQLMVERLQAARFQLVNIYDM